MATTWWMGNVTDLGSTQGFVRSLWTMGRMDTCAIGEAIKQPEPLVEREINRLLDERYRERQGAQT